MSVLSNAIGSSSHNFTPWKESCWVGSATDMRFRIARFTSCTVYVPNYSVDNVSNRTPWIALLDIFYYMLLLPLLFSDWYCSPLLHVCALKNWFDEDYMRIVMTCLFTSGATVLSFTHTSDQINRGAGITRLLYC